MSVEGEFLDAYIALTFARVNIRHHSPRLSNLQAAEARFHRAAEKLAERMGHTVLAAQLSQEFQPVVRVTQPGESDTNPQVFDVLSSWSDLRDTIVESFDPWRVRVDDMNGVEIKLGVMTKTQLERGGW